MSDRLILHEYSASGNCYKVRLTAALAGVQIERREYDIMKGETRTPEFLDNVNANGRIPVLQVGDRFIPESNAASYYVAEGSPLIPTDPFDHAVILVAQHDRNGALGIVINRPLARRPVARLALLKLRRRRPSARSLY